MRRAAFLVMTISLGLVSWTVTGAVSAEEPQVYSEFEEVIATDLIVELDEPLAKKYRKGNLGVDFEITVDGQPCEIVAVESPSAAEDEQEPWRLILYFDLELLNTSELRRAARLLSGVTSELVRLGEVEVVLADPIARRALPATRNLEVLDRRLAELALRETAMDRIGDLRESARESMKELEEVSELKELASAMAEAEAAESIAGLDRSLLGILDEGTLGSRRAVFLVTRSLVSEELGSSQGLDSVARPVSSPDDLGFELDSYSKTLAAYGWIVFPVVPQPPREDREAGFRVGKWRLFQHGLPIAIYEEDREPEKARAFSELGDSHRARGQWRQASEAYRKAVFHFQGDPKTQVEEVAVLGKLAEALSKLGKTQEAREVSRSVAELGQPVSSEEGEESLSREGFELLALVADSSSGHLIRDESDLAEALASLHRRVRITYQRSISDDRELLAVTAKLARPESIWLRAPAFTRRLTPTSVPIARARRLLAGDPLYGDLEFEAQMITGGEHGEEEAFLVVELPSSIGEWRSEHDRWRLTLVSDQSVQEAGPVQRAPELVLSDDDGLWRGEVEVPRSSLGGLVAVVIEEMRSGQWGAVLIEP